MTLNAWNGLPDPEAPKNLREGEPYNDPKFEELARTYGIWGTAQAALCAQFWQAARRAPAAPVTQGLREAAQRAHDWMESQADSQSKGNFHSFDLLCLRQERDALAEALAAAPQPPEAEPVQLPEPQAEIEVRSMKTYLDLSIHEWRDTMPDGEYKIYTEQQVRQLLAAHGIGKDKQG